MSKLFAPIAKEYKGINITVVHISLQNVTLFYVVQIVDRKKILKKKALYPF